MPQNQEHVFTIWFLFYGLYKWSPSPVNSTSEIYLNSLPSRHLYWPCIISHCCNLLRAFPCLWFLLYYIHRGHMSFSLKHKSDHVIILKTLQALFCAHRINFQLLTSSNLESIVTFQSCLPPSKETMLNKRPLSLKEYFQQCLQMLCDLLVYYLIIYVTDRFTPPYNIIIKLLLNS